MAGFAILIAMATIFRHAAASTDPLESNRTNRKDESVKLAADRYTLPRSRHALLTGAALMVGIGALAWANRRGEGAELAERTRARLEPRQTLVPNASDILITG